MFKDAHPLELMLFCVLTGVSFSLYAIVKLVPKDYKKPSTINYKIMSEEIEQIELTRRAWKSSGKYTADSDSR